MRGLKNQMSSKLIYFSLEEKKEVDLEKAIKRWHAYKVNLAEMKVKRLKDKADTPQNRLKLDAAKIELENAKHHEKLGFSYFLEEVDLESEKQDTTEIAEESDYSEESEEPEPEPEPEPKRYNPSPDGSPIAPRRQNRKPRQRR